jgi:hypothetical protein
MAQSEGHVARGACGLAGAEGTWGAPSAEADETHAARAVPRYRRRDLVCRTCNGLVMQQPCSSGLGHAADRVSRYQAVCHATGGMDRVRTRPGTMVRWCAGAMVRAQRGGCECDGGCESWANSKVKYIHTMTSSARTQHAHTHARTHTITGTQGQERDRGRDIDRGRDRDRDRDRVTQDSDPSPHSVACVAP